MKREGLLLNLLCIVLALMFFGVVVWNFLSVGTVNNFLTIDSLFLTVVCTLLALVLLINPLMSLMPSRGLKNPLKRGKAEGEAARPAALAGGATDRAALPPARATGVPAATSAKKTARTVPPDVENMVNRFRRPPENKA